MKPPRFVASSPGGKMLPASRPNLGVEVAYRRALLALVSEMQGAIVKRLDPAYRRQEKRIAMDETPTEDLASVLERLIGKWRKKFDELAPRLALKFVKGAASHADASFQRDLQREAFTIKFRPSPRVTMVAQAAVEENITLIKSIGERHLTEVSGLVMRSVVTGGDMGELTKDLRARYKITQRRAELIARDQNSKATSAINRERRLELGFTEAVWIHSGGGKEPRHSHVKAGAEKLRYDIRKGAYLDGEWIQPGELINCRCVSRSILPGYRDE